MTVVREELQKLGALIDEKMREDSLSLREFADKSKLSHSYVRNIKKGFDPRTGKQISPTVETLEKLAVGLDLTLQELLKITGFTLNADDNTSSTNKKPKDLLKILEQEEYTLNGQMATPEDKERIKRIVEAMYWDAKEKNKRK